MWGRENLTLKLTLIKQKFTIYNLFKWSKKGNQLYTKSLCSKWAEEADVTAKLKWEFSSNILNHDIC